MTDAITGIGRSRIVRETRAGVTGFVRHLDRALANPVAWLATCAGIIALQTLLIFTHEPWLDEYQAVLIAVQAPDISGLLEWLRYEGHPPLWYLILRGLAHFMQPLMTLKAAALGCALLVHVALLTVSPFTRAERLLIALSEFVLFEFLTVSRSLSLGTALLVLCMALWHRRSFWAAVALLPMCDFLFGVLSLALVAMKRCERALWWPGVLLWLVMGLLAVWAVIPASDVEPALQSKEPMTESLAWLLYSSSLAVPLQGFGWPQWNEPPTVVVAFWGWLAFLQLAWWQTSREPSYRWLMFGYIALTFVFSVAVYRLSTRHLMLTALFLILLVWRLRAKGERPRPFFRLWLMVIAACGLLTAAINLVTPFDTATVAAARIRELGLQDKHWMAYPDIRSVGAAAENNMALERDGLHCMQTFVRWNYRSRLTESADLQPYLLSEIERHGRSYLLSAVRLSGFPPDTIAEIDHIGPGYNGHHYFLYVVGRNAAERDVALPPCVPDARPFAKLGGSP